MLNKKIVIFFIFLLLFSSITYADIEAETRLFFESKIDKMVAQINSKIDTQSNRMGEMVKGEVALAKAQIREEMSSELKSNLMLIAVGLGGMMLVILVVFKLIEIKLDYSKRIKRYEDKLKSQMKKLDDLLKSNQIYRQQLDRYRDQIVQAVQKQRTEVNGITILPQETKVSPAKTFFKFDSIKFIWQNHKRIIKRILFFILLGITLFFVYKAGWIPNLAQQTGNTSAPVSLVGNNT